MALVNCYSRVFGFSTPNDTAYYYNFPSVGEHPAEVTLSELGTGIDTSITERTTLGEDSNWEVYSTYNAPFIEVYVREKSTDQIALLSFFSPNCGTMYICLGDEEDHETNYPYQYYAATEGYQQGCGMLTYNSSLVRRFIADTPILNYNWEPVSMISGKDKDVALTKIKDDKINDGSAVSDATSSYFANDVKTCNVGSIIQSLQPILEDDPVKVVVKYTIPALTDSTYTSVKLVAKKNKIPKNKTDGNKVVDLSSTSGVATVTGLESLTKYYFVIFVEDSYGNKADSDPKNITTGRQDGILRASVGVSKGLTDNDIKDYVSYEQVT